LENILSAQEAAATALNYVVVTQLQREGIIAVILRKPWWFVGYKFSKSTNDM
jgi:glycerol-3-phosphate dehydrogenase